LDENSPNLVTLASCTKKNLATLVSCKTAFFPSSQVLLTANPGPLQLEDGWAINGVGRHFSHKFGYGLMDAGAMVDLAVKWPGIGKQVRGRLFLKLTPWVRIQNPVCSNLRSG
jgi:hypothetical protein